MSGNGVTAWSYSRFALYAQCPLAFKRTHLDTDPKTGRKYKVGEGSLADCKESPALAAGNKRHSDVAAYLSDKAPLPAAEKAHAAFLAEVKAVPEKLVEHQQGFDRQWRPCGWFGNSTWYRQIYDVAVLYDDLSAECVDWKTGKRYGSNDEQMELQALSLMCQFKPAVHVTTRLFYLDSGEQVFAEFDASERDTLKQKWEAKVQPMFSDTVFAPRPNDKCRFCHFSQSKTGLCKFG